MVNKTPGFPRKKVKAGICQLWQPWSFGGKPASFFGGDPQANADFVENSFVSNSVFLHFPGYGLMSFCPGAVVFTNLHPMPL